MKKENANLEAGIAAKIAVMDTAVKKSGDELADRTKTFDEERNASSVTKRK